MKIIQLLVTLLATAVLSNSVYAQQYLNLRQDGHIYDVDVVVFARQLAQPSSDAINNQALVKNEAVLTLPVWDQQMPLFVHPQIAAPDNESEWQVPIDKQAEPVKVLSDIILSTSMDHAIINRLKANPTYHPIYHQKWRQMPSAFLKPQYVEVSSLQATEVTRLNSLESTSIPITDPPPTEDNPLDNQEDSFDNFYTNSSNALNVADYSIDGQVAFTQQRYTHLHVKMNLFRINAEGEQIIYQLSQQKRIELDKWQYFDHQQFGVLAKVTAIKLTAGE